MLIQDQAMHPINTQSVQKNFLAQLAYKEPELACNRRKSIACVTTAQSFTVHVYSEISLLKKQDNNITKSMIKSIKRYKIATIIVQKQPTQLKETRKT